MTCAGDVCTFSLTLPLKCYHGAPRHRSEGLILTSGTIVKRIIIFMYSKIFAAQLLHQGSFTYTVILVVIVCQKG